MALRPNDRQQLPDEVAAYVRELIFSGEVRPGEYLRLEPIAEAVGVSNTPVREGLLTLRSEGLIHLEPRRGFAVQPFSPQDVRDQFWAQAKLAGELAARAAKQVSAAQLAALEETHKAYESALANDDEQGIVTHGISFHRQVNRAAGAHRLGLILSSIAQQMPNRFYAMLERTSMDTQHEHAELLSAIASRNGRLARKLMEQHFLDRSDHLVALLEERGLWRDDQAGAANSSSPAPAPDMA